MGPFCIDDISDIVFFFSPQGWNDSPFPFIKHFFVFFPWNLEDLNLHFYALQIHKKLHPQSIFVNVVVQGHAIFAKKR